MSQPVLLGYNPDTLVVNVIPTDANFQPERRRLDALLEEELDTLKEKAQEQEEPVPTRWAFEGGTLFMKEKGGSHFKWILEQPKHPLITVAISRGVKVLMLGQVRFSSEYLWQEGQRADLGAAISKVHVFLTEIFGQHFILQLSALDLAADFLWTDIATANVKEQFITRATFDDERPLSDRQEDDGMIDGPESIKRRWRRVTGLPFGKRDAAVSALLYDKTHEIKYQSPDKRWLHDLWLSRLDEQGQPLWDGKAAVWRVEVRFRRKSLTEFKQEGVFHGIETAYDLLDKLSGLWAYAVGHLDGGADGLPDGWIRYVIPTADLNRSRWPVHPDWQVIQTAYQAEEDAFLESDYEREQREQEELLQQVDEELAARPFQFSDRSLLPVVSSPEKAAPVVFKKLDLAPFIRERKRQVQFERGFAALAGWLSTIEAWRDRLPDAVERDISETAHFSLENILLYLQERDKDFSETVQKKRVLYRLETAALA